jgi:endonuclease/exonuclease/phosphatase family metal-dependent hydrolase
MAGIMSIKFGLSRRKGITIALLLVVGAGFSAIFVIVPSMTGETEIQMIVTKKSVVFRDVSEANLSIRPNLRLMTLNIAHGRKDGPNQIFQKRKTIESHLNDIARVVRQEKPDVLALQEADGPSIWSGGFDQVAYLAEKANFAFFVRGEHVKGMRINYGTALLSVFPLSGAISFTFEPSPPTFSKGFVLATVSPSGRSDMSFDLVSVHLDFSRKSVREKQVDDMISRLLIRNRPLIIMGDFNCELKSKEATLRRLVDELDLKAYLPVSQNLETFPKLGKRLDWVLISPELEFMKYRVLPDVISDHYAVLCEVK